MRYRHLAARALTGFFVIDGESLSQHKKINEVAQSKLADKDLLQMFKEIETFQTDDKMVIKKLIDAFIAKKKIQELAKV